MQLYQLAKKRTKSKYPPYQGKDIYCVEADARFCNAPEGFEHVSETINSIKSGDLAYMTRL